MRKHQGFIALFSVIIISALLLTLTISANLGAFFTRFTLLDAEYKEKSKVLAESCVDIAILKIAENPAYAGNETITVESSTCAVRPISTSGSQKIIETSAIRGNAHTNIRASIDSAMLAVSTWEELPNF